MVGQGGGDDRYLGGGLGDRQRGLCRCGVGMVDGSLGLVGRLGSKWRATAARAGGAVWRCLGGAVVPALAGTGAARTRGWALSPSAPTLGRRSAQVLCVLSKPGTVRGAVFSTLRGRSKQSHRSEEHTSELQSLMRI